MFNKNTFNNKHRQIYEVIALRINIRMHLIIFYINFIIITIIIIAFIIIIIGLAVIIIIIMIINFLKAIYLIFLHLQFFNYIIKM